MLSPSPLLSTSPDPFLVGGCVRGRHGDSRLGGSSKPAKSSSESELVGVEIVFRRFDGPPRERPGASL